MNKRKDLFPQVAAKFCHFSKIWLQGQDHMCRLPLSHLADDDGYGEAAGVGGDGNYIAKNS